MTGAAVKVVALHIGAHKTGTSVVQDYLRRNRSALAKRRIEVLKRTPMGHLIRWGVALQEHPELMVARVDEFARSANADLLVGSNENTVGHPFGAAGRLYSSGPRNIEALARAIRTCRPRVVLSIRPQADFVESSYLQSVHQGGRATFESWFQGVDTKQLSWRPLVTALHDWIGPENTTILDFRTIKQGQAAYLSTFLRSIGVDFEPADQSEPMRNRSVSEKGLQLALIANSFPRTPEQRGAVRAFFQQHFSNVDYPRASLLTADQRRAIDDRYAAEYEELTA